MQVQVRVPSWHCPQQYDIFSFRSICVPAAQFANSMSDWHGSVCSRSTESSDSSLLCSNSRRQGLTFGACLNNKPLSCYL
jgi:hypothetical protein